MDPRRSYTDPFGTSYYNPLTGPGRSSTMPSGGSASGYPPSYAGPLLSSGPVETNRPLEATVSSTRHLARSPARSSGHRKSTHTVSSLSSDANSMPSNRVSPVSPYSSPSQQYSSYGGSSVPTTDASGNLNFDRPAWATEAYRASSSAQNVSTRRRESPLARSSYSEAGSADTNYSHYENIDPVIAHFSNWQPKHQYSPRDGYSDRDTEMSSGPHRNHNQPHASSAGTSARRAFSSVSESSEGPRRPRHESTSHGSGQGSDFKIDPNIVPTRFIPARRNEYDLSRQSDFTAPSTERAEGSSDKQRGMERDSDREREKERARDSDRERAKFLLEREREVEMERDRDRARAKYLQDLTERERNRERARYLEDRTRRSRDNH